MGPVYVDEHDRPSYKRTKSAARLFNELLERVSPDASSDTAKSPPFTSNEAVLPNITSSPPPMDAPNFTHTTSKSKDTPSNLPRHILESLQSQHNQHPPHDPPPTDSLPRKHPRSRTRHRSSRSSETISAMLLLATERLAQETSRANEAERQSSEILSQFKIAHHAKQRLEVDLQRTKNELGLYKTQLDNAQAEIRRAQEIVDKVDRQRADAEDEARRGRDKIRKLTEARSIELAMEEGRRRGYEEGMRQGRLMMQARDNESNQPTRYSRRTSVRTGRDEDDDDDQVTYFSYTQEEWQSADSFRSSSEPATSVRSLSRRRRTSDARHAANPISPVSTSPPTSHTQLPSSTQPTDNNTNQPENIAVRPHPTKDTNSTIPIRPISIQNHSPTVSHRSFKLPPDGFIPTLSANSGISLPPPHELSIPVPPTSASQPPATSSKSKQEGKKASTSRSSEHADRESQKRAPQSVDGDSTSLYTLSSQPHTNNRHKEHRRPRSESSGASTNMFQSSLLGPPDPNDTGKKENNEEDYFTAGARRIWSPPLQASTQFKKIPSKKRVNPDTILPSNPSPSPAQLSLDRDNELTSKMQGNFIIERPSSTGPTKRRPREIVLPTPLMGSLLNLSAAQKPNGTSQEAVHQWRNDIDRPHDTRPQYIHGSGSNTSVPGIEIMTPSSPTLSTPSVKTVIDPVLLSPESARATPLLQPAAEVPPTTSLGLYSNPPLSMSMSGDEQRITMVLPDNNLPPGFVPLSPIQGMKNLDSYPSGFAPSMSKLQDEFPGGQLPSNFSYPSSPLIK